MNELDSTAEPTQPLEQDRLNLYGGILYREAFSLLGQYLPIALPQEPTKLFFDTQPQYIGKFKGKHYINAEKFILSSNDLTQMQNAFEREKKLWDRWKAQELKFIKLLEENAAKGIFDIDFESMMAGSEELEVKPIPTPAKDDWEEPKRLLAGRGEYSVDTWGGIYTVVHELIHQKQAELNPQAFPDLSSPQLGKIDPNGLSETELRDLLVQAHKAVYTKGDNSLFLPVIEGMAVAGSFFVISRLLSDVKKDGHEDMAAKIRQTRSKTIKMQLSETGKRTGYDANYIAGTDMVRRLYNQFGFVDTPALLTKVDLQACQQIAKGSPRYQEIVQNPALLPGLPKAA